MQLEDKLYTSTEVAQILGVSLRSVYRYLDEGKLDAAVKTATGRHRFTKQNILDFLYPSDSNKQVQKPTNETRQVEAEKVVLERTEVINPNVDPATVAEEELEEEEEVSDQPEPVSVQEEVSNEEAEIEPDSDDTTGTEEEPVDWLEKFRAAAVKYREESQQTDSIGTFASQQAHAQIEEEIESQPKGDQLFYYRSLTGGLKDIAQNIDKSAKKASVDYAFTMNAGLSLHKPIRPFSLLHAYIRPEDRDFFERMLHLVPAEEGNAQLALIATDNNSIFTNKKEMHGLSVVSDTQLKRDLSEYGEEELASEFISILS
jgi:excisionase family DNA binding protein